MRRRQGEDGTDLKKIATNNGCYLSGLSAELVRTENDNFLSDPSINLLHSLLPRREFVANKYQSSFLQVAEAASVIGDDSHHLRWNAVRAKQAIAAGHFDVKEVIAGGDFA